MATAVRDFEPAAACAGFTLIELLVVLVIMGIMASAIPHFLGNRDAFELRAAGETLAADLRVLRDEAIRRHAPTALLFAPGQYVLSPAGRRQALPANTSASLIPSDVGLVSEGNAVLRFFPDGSSTGAALILRRGVTQVTLLVRGIDGHVTNGK